MNIICRYYSAHLIDLIYMLLQIYAFNVNVKTNKNSGNINIIYIKYIDIH